MDLLIAIMQRATVLDVGSHSVDRCWRQRPDRDSQVLQRVKEVAVGLAKGGPEGRRHGSEVWLLGNLDTRLPRLEAIDIGRFNGALRMESTRFTAVFDVDPEDDPFSLGRPAAFDVIRRGNLADSREDDGVGWGRTRLRTAH